MPASLFPCPSQTGRAWPTAVAWVAFWTLVGLSLLLGIAPARAATFTVTNLNDSGAGSLRQALADANAGATADTIQFASRVKGRIILNSALTIANPVTLTGPGAKTLAILTRGEWTNSAQDVTLSGLTLLAVSSTILRNTGTLTLDDCTLTDAVSSAIVNSGPDAVLTLTRSTLSDNSAGAIYNDSGTLTIADSTLSDNSGGAIYNGSGTLTIADSTLSGNSAGSSSSSYGGAIYNDSGKVKITNSTLSGNSATASGVAGHSYGGAIYNDSGTLTITNSTLSKNYSFSPYYGGYSNSSYGGAIYNDSGKLTITNSTLSGNSAQSSSSYSSSHKGGAIYNDSGKLTITNSTLSGNSAGSSSSSYGGAIYNGSGTLTITNSTFSRNSADDDGGAIYNDTTGILVIGNSLIVGNTAGYDGPTLYNKGLFYSDGHNLFGENEWDGLSGAEPDGSDLTLSGKLDTALAPLADHGGLTKTHLLIAGSPALDAGDNALIPKGVTTDQRGAGYPRIVKGSVDIGAIEGTGGAAPAVALTVTRTGDGTLKSTPQGIDCGEVCAAEFGKGTKVTLAATPAAGQRIANWGGACAATPVTKKTCTLTLKADTEVTIDFAPQVADPYRLTVSTSGQGTVTSEPGGIDCGVECQADFAAGTPVTLTATPAEGHHIASWGGACAATPSTETTCALTMSADRAVLVQFAPSDVETYSLVVVKQGSGEGQVISDPAGIDCGLACDAEFAAGTTVTLTATPAEGSLFVRWGGACAGTQTRCTIEMDDLYTARATFQPVPGKKLTVVKSGQGRVTSDPAGIDCGPTCAAAFPIGTPVTLTATPATGYSFAGWSGDCTGTDPCTLTLDQEHQAAAVFEAIQPRLLTVVTNGRTRGTVTSDPPGITCGVDCEESFAKGTQVTLTATPKPGYRFDRWSGACQGQLETCTLTLNQKATAQASFIQVRTYPLTVKVDPATGGTVTSEPAGIDCGKDCAEAYAQGTRVLLRAKPRAGYEFVGWEGACKGSGGCVMTMQKARIVTARFAHL